MVAVVLEGGEGLDEQGPGEGHVGAMSLEAGLARARPRGVALGPQVQGGDDDDDGDEHDGGARQREQGAGPPGHPGQPLEGMFAVGDDDVTGQKRPEVGGEGGGVAIAGRR